MAKNTSPIPIIILAAGASHRFGSDKLLTLVAGKRLIDWSIEAAIASNLGQVIVVTNPNRQLHHLGSAVTVIVNHSWQTGLSSSIRCGLHTLLTTTSCAAIFTPSDQPLLTPDVYKRIVDRFYQQSSSLIVASYDSQPRNPVLLTRELWKAASHIQGDVGLSVLARSGTAELVECADIASVVDIDQPADLFAIEKMLFNRVQHSGIFAANPPKDVSL